MSSTRDFPALLGGDPVRRDGPPAWPPHEPEVVDAIRRAAESGAWGRYLGPAGDELRRTLQVLHDVEHVWLCSSGTAAVELALRGVGVSAGDEVILAAYDFKANFANILALGALPVLIDLRPDDWQLDVERLPAALTPQTKAVIASHLHGGIVDMRRLREAIGDRPVAIIEDACQCPGTWIDGSRAGTLGEVGVLSFGGSKLTCAGRGGAVVTRNPHIIERIKRHTQRGNDLSPLSELQAAALVPQWKRLDERNRLRGENVRFLHEHLPAGSGLRMLAAPTAERTPGYYKVGFEYDSQALDGLSRDLFCEAMQAEGVAFFPGFRALHRIHASRRFRLAGSLPVADRADNSIAVLHHPVLLGASSDLEQIVEAVAKVRCAAAEIRRFVAEQPPISVPAHE